ncbi:MAG: P-loop NTPase fold protein [bacterium]
MKKIDIHSTFIPGQEITDPDQFAGRRNNIAQAIKALCRPGTSILVYGERGVGKTSFVEMVKLMAQGQVELLYRHKFKFLVPKEGFNYQVISIECDEDVKNTDKVLQRLITSPEGISGLLEPRINKIETTVKDHFALNLFKKIIGFDSSTEEKSVKETIKEMSIYELFTNLIILITQKILKPEEGLLIVIDEFDRVNENSKISSLIKTLSKNKVKFLISGIAESYFELLEQHSSIERQLFQGKIKIEPMLHEEIEDIFNLVSKNTEGAIKFKNNIKEEIIKRCGGYPYYVHLFGQIALDHFCKIYGIEARANIGKEHLLEGLKDFAQYEPKLEKIYLQLVGNDPERELLLKALSSQIPNRIHQDMIFNYCRKREMTKTKQLLAYFLSMRNPKILERIEKDFITFSDPLFKIYASTRSPILIEKTPNGFQLPASVAF